MTQPHPYGQQPGQPQQAAYPQQPGQPQQAGYPQQPVPPHPGTAAHPGQAAYPHQPGQPQHHGHPGNPGPTPPAAKPRKPLWKRWWFWVLAIVALFIVIGIAGGGGDESAGDDSAADSADTATTAEDTDDEAADGAGEAADEEGEASGEEAAASGAEYGIGDAVATGDWEITVTDVESGVSEVGDEFLSSTAQGQFVLVEISVKNTGSSPDFFYDGDVKLKDDAGNTYATDSEAGIYAASDNDVVLLEEINPGNTASGMLVFDVPADAAPNVLEFQGGLFDTPGAVALD